MRVNRTETRTWRQIPVWKMRLQGHDWCRRRGQIVVVLDNGGTKKEKMSWTGSESERRSQQTCHCPEEFRGNRRYVTKDECQRFGNQPVLGGLMPFGKYRGKPISTVPRGYLQWVLRNANGQEDLKKIIRKLLQ